MDLMFLNSVIKIVNAIKEGQIVEYRKKVNGEWNEWETLEDYSMFSSECEYRISVENKYRPYVSSEEFYKDVKKKGSFLLDYNTGEYVSISSFDYNSVVTGIGYQQTYKEIIKQYCWASDMSVCGVIKDDK